MKMSKKGISPLVATVLLVAFSVALGALVMSWGQDYIEEKAEFVQGIQEVKSGCDVANLNVIKIGGIPQVCIKDTNKIQVWFDNGPDIDIYQIHARIVGTDGISVQEGILKERLQRENAVKAEFTFDPVGVIRQIKFTPKIFVVDKVYFCSQKAIAVENIPPC